MADYDTNLKTWGDSGIEYPDGYSYLEGEQPVDDWDNFIMSNVIGDLSYLIALTNDRIESDKGLSGNKPTDPEKSHLYHDTEKEALSLWNARTESWRELLTTDFDGKDLTDENTTIWDSSAGIVPQSILGGPASKLSSYPLLAKDLEEDYALTSRFPIGPTDIDGSVEHSFSGGVTGLPAPSDDSDAVTKEYADALEQGLDIKDSVRVATDGSNIDLTASTDPSPVDGVTLSDGDRVLLKDQTTASENGIYEAVTATDPTTWVRSADADEDSEVTSGMFVFIEEGTASAGHSYVLNMSDPISLGTDDITFTVFAKAGEITAGTNMNRNGDTLDVDNSPDFTGDVSVDGSVKDESGNKILDNVVATGNITLSDGLAELTTDISETDATFMLALGIDDPNADVEVAGALFWDDSAGNYEIRIRETETSVGNPTVNYDVIRVR